MSGPLHGPLTEYEAAAADYGARLGWSCGAYRHAVWLLAHIGIAGLDFDPSLAERIIPVLPEAPGPVIGYPSGRVVILTRCADPTHGNRAVPPHFVHWGYRTTIDLPPTRTLKGDLAWLAPPQPGADLPECEQVLTLVSRFYDSSGVR